MACTLNEHAYTGIAAGQPESQFIGKYTLGADQYWVMADSRLAWATTDSRAFGPLSRKNIIGRAEFVYWPLREFHWIENYSSVFSAVPAARPRPSRRPAETGGDQAANWRKG